jgi:hypothetical protein
LRLSVVALGSLVAALVLAEAYFRIIPELKVLTLDEHADVSKIISVARNRHEPTIDRLWSRSHDEKPNPFEPPFEVFINRGFDHRERMDFIAETSRLPPSRRWLVPNFLIQEEYQKHSLFRVTSNSLGFRGPERSVKKPKGTFRILAFGSYATFGHGVNDEDTYLQRLEDNLNKWKPGGFRYEVWNGGRQGGMAIMGLARLEREALAYEPDMIIWDYGWMDMHIKHDRLPRPGGNRWRIRKLMPAIGKLYYPCTKRPLAHLRLCNLFTHKVGAVDKEEILKGFHEANRRMLRFAGQYRIPVVFLKHEGVSISRKQFEGYQDPEHQVFFLDTSTTFHDQPVQKADEERFWKKPYRWVDSVGVSRELIKGWAPLIYRGDPIQYGEIGHKVIGEYVSKEITKLIQDGAIGPPGNTQKTQRTGIR